MATIFDVLLNGTTGDVQVWNLPNIKGEGDERWTGTRSAARLETWVERKDVPGTGTFFCVSTLEPRQRRKKEHAIELPFLFGDVDFKFVDLPKEEILGRLLALPLPPSRIHATGGGYHCFWVLDEPVTRDGMDGAERLLRLLASRIGMDRMVAHRVALLRVPGTHNSKRVGPGDGRGVRTEVVSETGQLYSLSEIDAWLASLRGSEPILPQHDRPQDANPFSRLAETQELRGPMDVEAALAAMAVGFNVHDTQLSAMASLAVADVDEDDAVGLVLEATRSLPGAENWDWTEEERNLRRMHRDAVKKFGVRGDAPANGTTRDQGRPQAAPGRQSVQSVGVVSLADARAKRQEAEAQEDDDEEADPKKRALGKISKKLKNDHVVIGRWILEVLHDQDRALLYTDNQAWMYREGVWTSMVPETEKSWASVMVEQACRAAKLVSTTKLVNETRAWLQREPDLHKEDVKWDQHGGIAVKNGVLNYGNGTLLPYKPEYYVTRRIDCDYDADARCPVWEKMLAEDYQFDRPTISFLQEFLGTSLVSNKPRTLTRALVLLGPSNTGKSNILNAMAGLHGEMHNTTPLKALSGTHGSMQFLHPNPWVLHEAFEQSSWEMSDVAKAIISGDPFNINVKNAPIVTQRHTAPILWGTNVPPQFKEASRAMENRLAIVRMHRSFDPLNVEGTALEALRRGYRTPAEWVLNDEKKGLLNWAIAGWKRARERGHFEFTTEMMQSLHQMRMEGNMASGFVEECCEYDPNIYLNVGDFYGAFSVWHADHRGGNTPSVDSLGRAMQALADDRLVCGGRINRQRVYAGIKLNEEGLDNWNAFQSSVMAERTGLRVASSVQDVNKYISPSTMDTDTFARLRFLAGR